MAHLKTFRFRDSSRAILAVCLALLSLPCSVYLFGPPIRARYLLHELGAVQVGRSNYEDAQRLARKLGAKPDDLNPCTRSYCYWSAVVNNARLPQWWRDSGVTFVIDFEVKDSVVAYKGAGYAIGIDPYGRTQSMVSAGMKEKWIQTRRADRVIVEPPTGAGWEISYFEKNGSREVATAKFVVRMTPRSSPEDWQRYTAFNYACFWKYKGCKDARELLPAAASSPIN